MNSPPAAPGGKTRAQTETIGYVLVLGLVITGSVLLAIALYYLLFVFELAGPLG